MKSFLTTRGLARASARRPWIVIGAWVLVLAIGGGLAAGAGAVFTTDVEFTNEEESQLARDRLEAVRGSEPLFEQVIVQSETLTVDDPQFAATVGALHEELLALTPQHLEFVLSFYETGDPTLVSADRHTTLLVAKLIGDIDDAAEHVEPLVEVLHEFDGEGGFTVVTGGFGSISSTSNEIAESDLATEFLAMPFALVVLIVVFGAVVAAFVPMVVAVVAIMLAMISAMLLSNAFPLSIFVTNIILTMGLALGIDYSLFIVERFREERAHGREKLDAIEVAGDTASRAVLFSGMTVVISLCGMLIVPTTIFRSLGAGAIFAAIASVAVGLTLLPALLSLLGDRVNRLPVPLIGRSGPVDADRGFWAAAARRVMAHPVLSLVLSGGLLIGLAIPYTAIDLGFGGASTLPENTDSYRAFQILDAEFSAGRSIPTQVVVTAADVNAPAVAGAIGRMEAAIEADLEIVITPSPTDGASADGSLWLTTVALPGDSASDEALDALARLREEIAPAAFVGVDAQVAMGGQSAVSQDFFDMVGRFTPIVFAFVLGLSFLLLMVVFHSLIVPLKAIVMNLLSVGAAYGMLVLIFQQGVGADLLGFQTVPSIEAWVPLFLFMILFGLSMDYQVFLLSRIRERYDRIGDNTEAVAFGLRSTANIITGAAIIMVVVFGGFALGDLVMFQQMGFGIGFAVLLDATVVRMVLVPSAMELLGDRNWYLPSWLKWIPDLRVEGPAREPAPAPAYAPVIAGGDQ